MKRERESGEEAGRTSPKKKSFQHIQVDGRGRARWRAVLSDGWMLRVGGGEREPEDQRGDREAAAERQEGLSQGAEAAAVG